jgi:hypothetical protein
MPKKLSFISNSEEVLNIVNFLPEALCFNANISSLSILALIFVNKKYKSTS